MANSAPQQPKEPENSIECQLCIYVAEFVVKGLNQNNTEEEILQELDKICSIFPVPLRNQCVAFLNEYGIYVVKLVAAQIDPLKTCTSLKLCTTTTVTNSRYRFISMNRGEK